MSCEPVTQTCRNRFWADTGTTVLVFDNDEVDDIFAEAGETYTDEATIKAYTRVIGIQRLLASSTKLTDYTQNQSNEKQSQVFDHLKDMLGLWKGKTSQAEHDAAIANSGAARFGSMRRKPKRYKEYPGAPKARR